MDDLIAEITAKTGLAKDQATEVVGIVRDRVLGALPDDLTEQVQGYLAQAGAMTGSAVDATKDVAGAAADVTRGAASVASAATKGAADSATQMAGEAWQKTKGAVNNQDDE